MSACIENITYSEEISLFSSHKHNVYQVIYITEGLVELDISNKLYTINAPAVVFISHLEEHNFKIKSKTYKRFALYISPEKLKSVTRDTFQTDLKILNIVFAFLQPTILYIQSLEFYIVNFTLKMQVPIY